MTVAWEPLLLAVSEASRSTQQEPEHISPSNGFEQPNQDVPLSTKKLPQFVEVCIPVNLSDVTDRSEESYKRESKGVKGKHRDSIWPKTPLFEAEGWTKPGGDGTSIRH